MSKRVFIDVLIVAVAACMADSCRPTPRPAAEGFSVVEKVEEIVWPLPPDPPRIRYVGSFSGSDDLLLEKSLLERLGEFVLGRGEDGFVRPTGVAAGMDLLAIADPGSPALFILDIPGKAFRKVDQGGDGDLVSPVGVAVSEGGLVYLTDSYLGAVYVYDRSGRLNASWGRSDLVRPTAIALDEPRRRAYVLDAAAHRIVIYDLEGKMLSAIGQRGSGEAEFNWPGHLCVDRDGTLYVVDSLNFRVQIFSPDETVKFLFGHNGNGSGDLARPKGIAVDRGGHIYVVDALFDAAQIFNRQGEFLLSFGRRGMERGEFWLPTGVAIDEKDRIFVADSYNQRIQVFQFVGD